MKKRLFAALLALAMALALLPSAALAAPGKPPTEVYVGNEPVTTGYSTAKTLCGGTVQYNANAATGVLILNGVTVTADNYSSGKAAIYADGDLVIELVGVSTVTGPATSGTSSGIAVDGSLTIQGGGQLTATGTGWDVSLIPSSAGILATGDITVLSGTVKGVGGKEGDVSAGVRSLNGSITVSGGSLEGVGGSMTLGMSYGLLANNDAILTGGAVKGVGGNEADASVGVCADAGDIAITGGTVLAKSGTAPTTCAFDKQPGFGTNDTWYRWRTGAGGGYTVSSATEQYVRNASDTYVEIRPVESPIPKTGDTAMPYLWAGLALLAGAGLVVLRRRRRSE